MTAASEAKNASPINLRRRLIQRHFARKPLILLAAVLSMAASAPASHAEDASPHRPENLQELDQALGKIFADGAIPGASVAIIENGRVVFTKGYGVSDTATKKPVTPDTVFRAGSISKSLTGIAIMTAVEAGQLSLDGKLSELAPDVKFDNPWEASNPIRLVNLLEHTTGWPDVSFRVLTMDGKGWSLQRGVEFTSPEFVSRWQPGRFAVYNNSGPAVAGLVLERASGQEFNRYMRAHVLRPMGMVSSDFELTPELAKRLSKSYLSNGRVAPFQNIILGPSGSLDASVAELAQLVRFYLGRGTIDAHRLLTAKSIERIERGESSLAAGVGLTTGSYGLGNTPSFDQGVTFRGHNGQIDAFTSVYAYTLQNNSGYVLMANGGEGVDFADPASRLVQSYLTRHSPPVIAANVRVDAKALARYAGLYRRMTPDNAFTRPFQALLGLTRVSAENDKLKIGGKDYFPASQHLFRRADRDSPNIAFVEKDGEIYMVSAKGATVREPMWRAIIIAAVLATLALGLVIAIFMCPVWLVAWARGRLAHRGGALIRFLPLLAFTALGISFILPMAILFSGDVAATRALATPGMVSITVFICSLLFPLLSALGLWRAIKANATGIFVRAYVGLTSLALLTFSGYAASIGWVGARTWMM
jgi:CubicO group peptidase (beta-lactamase class C family)